MVGQGKAVVGQGKAVKGQGKAVEDQGKAVVGQGKAAAGQGNAAKGQRQCSGRDLRQAFDDPRRDDRSQARRAGQRGGGLHGRRTAA